MDDLTRLVAVEEIKKLKARYYRFLDSKDWVGFQSLFTEDLVFDFTKAGHPPGITEGVQLVHGPADATKWAEDAVAGGVTLHQGHMPEIEITSETTATGIWAMADRLWFPVNNELPFRELEGFGHYYEDYRKVDGKWLIAKLQLTRIRAIFKPWHEGF